VELTLRFPEPPDAEEILAAVLESMAELHRWMAWCHPGFALADAARWVAEQTVARQEGTAFEFVILDGGGGLLGCCGINQINPAYPIANLGYWVRSSAAGRGIATEAAKRLAAWAYAVMLSLTRGQEVAT
jgi:RimJ/RimL family protein N-acetyltransferase